MKLLEFAFSKLHGSAENQVGLLYGMVKQIYSKIREAINANEGRVLLDEQTVSNAPTLDLGDINGPGFYSEYAFLRVELRNFIPVTDGDYLQIRYGGAGSWWSAGSYAYNTAVYGASVTAAAASGQTQMVAWPNSGTWNQGNQPGLEEMHGIVVIGLRELMLLSGHPCFCNFMWADTASSPYKGEMNGRFVSASALTAVRMFYGGGNIFQGKAYLWGLKKV